MIKVFQLKIFPAEDFCRMSYAYFYALDQMIDVNIFNGILEKFMRTRSQISAARKKLKLRSSRITRQFGKMMRCTISLPKIPASSR